MTLQRDATAASAVPPVDLSTDLVGWNLPNPVMTASGCAAAGRELDPFIDLQRLGAVVTKTIMVQPRSGRPVPRMVETPSGMLNSIGLQGPGIDGFIEHDLAWLTDRGVRTVVSIAGNDAAGFAAAARAVVAARASGASVGALEVNISCPNVANRGLVFACAADSATAVVRAVRSEVPRDLPLIVKLSPDVTDITEIARAVVGAGADGLTLINTVLGLAIDPVRLRPVLGGITGGLSGPAVRPIALRCVYQVHAALPEVPIIGVGGIRTGADAIQFAAAGASAVQVGTVNFADPGACDRIADEIAAGLRDLGVQRWRDIIGVAHRGGITP